MSGFLKWLWGLIVGWIKSLGRRDLLKEQQEKIDAVEKHWREIDAGPADLDGALGNLRKRSRRKTGVSDPRGPDAGRGG
jgi:hypothetical protein